MEAFDIFKALVPSNNMSYGLKFNCANSSWHKLPVLDNIAFRMEAFDIFKTLVQSNNLSYEPEFNCADSSWPKLPENANPPLWRHRLHTVGGSRF